MTALLDGATGVGGLRVVDELDALRHEARVGGRRLVLVGVALANAADLVDVHGADALQTATRTVAERLAGPLLHVSPLGEFLAAVLTDEAGLEAGLTERVARMRDFVVLAGDQVWPVVTTCLRVAREEDQTWELLRDVRTTLRTTLTRSPGSCRWHDTAAPDDGRDRLEVVRDLARALRHDPGQLDLAYQPVRALDSGALLGAEALLRWTHPTYGPVSPLVAVAAAEESGLIHDLGRHVLDRALQQAGAWRRELGAGFTIHVNASPYQLREPQFGIDVVDLLHDSGVPPEGLLLELTESDLLTDDPAVLRTLVDLREVGVRLGIDDFGTGYSSIAQLHQLPVDTVKIDRSLVAGIATSPADFDLLSSVVALLATSEVTLVAEGIENAVQVAHLRALGCPAGQGYHLGRPGPADRLLHQRPGGAALRAAAS